MKCRRLAVITLLALFLSSLFGCGEKHILDGPGMERRLWSAFTISRCNEKFEPFYSYTVKYDQVADEAYLYEGQDEENSIQLRRETVSALHNLNLMMLPDEGAVTGNFLGLTLTDSQGEKYPKSISGAMENEILQLLSPYLDELEKGSGEKPVMLDGPGMEYQSPWTAFTLTRTDSNTRYSFWFTITDDGEQALVTGECNDEDGNSYLEETGAEVSAGDLWQLRWMDFDQLPEEEPWPEDLERPTDMANITLAITLRDGTVEEKSASSDLSIKIYELLLPYLKNN